MKDYTKNALNKVEEGIRGSTDPITTAQLETSRAVLKAQGAKESHDSAVSWSLGGLSFLGIVFLFLVTQYEVRDGKWQLKNTLLAKSLYVLILGTCRLIQWVCWVVVALLCLGVIHLATGWSMEWVPWVGGSINSVFYVQPPEDPELRKWQIENGYGHTDEWYEKEYHTKGRR